MKSMLALYQIMPTGMETDAITDAQHVERVKQTLYPHRQGNPVKLMKRQ